jgi:serine/threonine protein kinase/tetratricopeptide (TPR) repeat protein
MICPQCQADNEDSADSCFTCGQTFATTKTIKRGSVIASRYEVLSPLGKGGMGMVYKAHDRVLDETVALKVLRPDVAREADMARRFRSEIKLARKVSHPNVCRIHEYGEDGGVSYISMALIEGTDLRRRLLASPEGLPTDEAFDVSIQVAEGLQAIHDVGIIHRDLKTPNIVLDDANVVKLMDFGIAKESNRSGGITATGEVMGTPEYMSPEQCRGDRVDFRSDVYALGIVVYETFTGRVPFHGDTLMATLLKQLQDPPPLEGPVAAAIPPSLVGVLRKALAKEPDKRYASSADLSQALRKARQDYAVSRPREFFEPTRSLPPAEERRRHSRLEISVDVILKRLSAGGAVMQEERTVADNIGRRGARVMTAMTGLSQGDSVVLQEVGNDFQAKAVVRYVYKPTDSIQRLGLEFLDRTAPDRLVPTDKDSGKSRVPRTGSSPASSPTPTTARAFVERRRTGRHAITVDVLLKRLGQGDETVEEERTVADNIGRHGARLLTGMANVGVGERVLLKEVGSDFQTKAAVRNAFTGKDNIPRLGVEFLDRQAPDHLVPTYESQQRLPGQAAPPASDRFSPIQTASSMTPPAMPTPAPRPRLDPESLAERRREVLEAFDGLKARNHFEVLGIPRASNATQVREAYVRLTRRFHPDAREPQIQDLKPQAEAVFLRIAEAYETLINTERRSRYESALGRSTTPRSFPTPPPAPKVEPPPPPPAPQAPWVQDQPRDPDSDSRLAAQVLNDAKKLLADEKYWDAIQMLEAALDLAKGGKVNHAIRIMLARAVSKNPKWLKRGESILLSVIAEEPTNVEAYMTLGRLYGAAGLKGRAIAQYRKVLEIHPRNAEAATELRALDPSALRRRGSA